MWNVFWNIHMYIWIHPRDLDIQVMDYEIWLVPVLKSVLTTAQSMSSDVSDRIPFSVQGIQSDTQQTRKGYRRSNTTGDEVTFPRPGKNGRRNEGEGMSKMPSCSMSMWAWAHLSPSLTVSSQTEATLISFLLLERDFAWPLPMKVKHAVRFRKVSIGKRKQNWKKQHKSTLWGQKRSEEQSEDEDPAIRWQFLPSGIYPLRALWQLLLKWPIYCSSYPGTMTWCHTPAPAGIVSDIS